MTHRVPYQQLGLFDNAPCNCMSHNGFLTRLGYRAVDAGWPLTGPTECVRLDSIGSVSGLRRDETTMIWDEEILDEQHRRFLEVVGAS